MFTHCSLRLYFLIEMYSVMVEGSNQRPRSNRACNIFCQHLTVVRKLPFANSNMINTGVTRRCITSPCTLFCLFLVPSSRHHLAVCSAAGVEYITACGLTRWLRATVDVFFLQKNRSMKAWLHRLTTL